MTKQHLTWMLVLSLVWGGALAIDSRAGAAPGSTTRIAGFDMECRDIRGRPVQNTHVTDLGDVGRAWVLRSIPYIVMDKVLLAKLPEKLQLFFYVHECAHHVLGHWYNVTRTSEQEADCWAIKQGRNRGYFTRGDVVKFKPYFAKSRGSTWGHLPGPKRVEFLLNCFDDPR